MAGKYSISDVNIASDDNGSSIVKNVKLSVNGRSISNISKCTERTTDSRTLKMLDHGSVINECYIDLTLDKLRELDDDRYAQERYIMSRSKFLDKGMINTLIVKLQVGPGQNIENQDYEYLNALLNWGRNDIYIMPIIDYTDKSLRVTKPELYINFVKTMLAEKESWIRSNCNIGMSVPVYFPRAQIGNLFKVYSDEKPTFVAVDFNNSRMDKPGDTVGTILKHFRDENEEKTFFYGINVKPYKKGQENTSAWDIYLAHGSFNAIGPTHSKPHAVIAPAEWGKMGRIFDQKTVQYTTVDNPHRDDFINWVDSTYEITLDTDYNKNERGLYTYLKRYNFQHANDVLFQFSDAVRKSDNDFIQNMINVMPDEMKSVNILEQQHRKRKPSKL